MFKNLPDDLDGAVMRSKTDKNWKGPLSEDFHVRVYEDQGNSNCLIFAPVYSTIAVLDDCFSDAMRKGRNMVVDGKCTSFKIKYVYDSKKDVWPHVVLSWR